jgi:hypothetical protein
MVKGISDSFRSPSLVTGEGPADFFARYMPKRGGDCLSQPEPGNLMEGLSA